MRKAPEKAVGLEPYLALHVVDGDDVVGGVAVVAPAVEDGDLVAAGGGDAQHLARAAYQPCQHRRLAAVRQQRVQDAFVLGGAP